MAEKTIKIGAIGILRSVQQVRATGKYRFKINVTKTITKDPADAIDGSLGVCSFDISPARAMSVADSADRFPLGTAIKITGRLSVATPHKFNHVNILSVDGIEISAWSERVGSSPVHVESAAESQSIMQKAKKAEEAMVNRAPPEQPGAITDPLKAYDNAMRIVRRQRRLKNPQLSQQEIWEVRDALNLLAEKLGIAS